MNETHKDCGGTILSVGGELAHVYCDRCLAFIYKSEGDTLPSGTDRALNKAAYDDGSLRSPESPPPLAPAAPPPLVLPPKEEVAKRFADKVKDNLTAAQWKTMRERNRYEPEGYCASQDFVAAANIMMDCIGESVKWEGDVPVDVATLFNDAWDIAKREYLTARDADGPTTRS